MRSFHPFFWTNTFKNKIKYFFWSDWFLFLFGGGQKCSLYRLSYFGSISPWLNFSHLKKCHIDNDSNFYSHLTTNDTINCKISERKFPEWNSSHAREVSSWFETTLGCFWGSIRDLERNLVQKLKNVWKEGLLQNIFINEQDPATANIKIAWLKNRKKTPRKERKSPTFWEGEKGSQGLRKSPVSLAGIKT